MKVIFEKKTEIPPTFPCLMELVGNPEEVVLFFSPMQGICVNPKDNKYLQLCIYASANDTSVWQPTTGKVTFEF